jgi:hypothetical protein
MLLLVSVAGVLASAWFIWRPAASVESPRLGLTLLVNQQSRVEITAGTPLVFELSLGSRSSAPAFTVGTRWHPWHTLGRIENADASALPWALTKVGQRSLHVVRQADGRQEVTVDSGAVAQLEAGRHVHTLTWAAGPEDTSRITPGTYQVRAVLETPSWMLGGWHGRAVSAPATIVVRGTVDGVSRELDAQRMARTADYYGSLEKFAEAHAAATALVKLEPREATAHILLGDALAGLKRRSEALEAYQRAMSLLPRSIEEPTLLDRRIKSVMELGRQEPR